METCFYVEFRLESNPDAWKRCTAYHFKDFNKAEADVQECLKRQAENGETNYKTFKDRVLEYRIVMVDTTIKETILSNFLVKSHAKLIKSREEEFYYLNQVYKYLKYLEHLYTSSKLEDENQAWQISISLKNTETQRKTVAKKLHELTGKKYEDTNS